MNKMYKLPNGEMIFPEKVTHLTREDFPIDNDSVRFHFVGGGYTDVEVRDITMHTDTDPVKIASDRLEAMLRGEDVRWKYGPGYASEEFLQYMRETDGEASDHYDVRFEITNELRKERAKKTRDEIIKDDADKPPFFSRLFGRREEI